MSEARDRTLQDDRQSPEVVLPDPDALKVSIGSIGVAEQAARLAAVRIAHELNTMASVAMR